jgi:hypothetical protein
MTAVWVTPLLSVKNVDVITTTMANTNLMNSVNNLLTNNHKHNGKSKRSNVRRPN